MSTQPGLIFNPVTGTRLTSHDDHHPDAWRAGFEGWTWSYDPWVASDSDPNIARQRPEAHVEADPLGRLLQGPVLATCQQLNAKSAPTKDSNPKSAAGDAKVPLFLCSPIAMAEWALAQFAGMEKYGLVNWREAGVRASTYVSAMLRHAEAFNAGEDRDPDDDTDHLGNIMACCAILMEARALGLLTDDRPRAIDFRPTWAGVQQRMGVIREKYADRMPTHYTIERDKKLADG